MTMIKLIHGDCLEKMAEIEDGSVDMVLTDPPYRCISGGTSSKLSKRHSGSMVTSKNDGKIFKENHIYIKQWMPEIYRVLGNGCHCYIMTNVLNLPEMLTCSIASGFKLHNLLVWEKNNATPNRWYMKNCEYILFLRKGKATPIRNMGSKTVHSFENPVGKKCHPSEKSIPHMEFLIENSSSDLQIVLDPFMGSGTTGVACKNLNRSFIGIEKDDEYFQLASDRIHSHNNLLE